jgi:hypothetical protein
MKLNAKLLGGDKLKSEFLKQTQAKMFDAMIEKVQALTCPVHGSHPKIVSVDKKNFQIEADYCCDQLRKLAAQ